MFIEEINNNECMYCLKPFKHYKMYKCIEKSEQGYLKELEFIVHCSRCRDVLSKCEEILKRLQLIEQEKITREFEKFCSNK